MSKLFYIIGASGAGKDSVMSFARNRISGSKPVIFAHRYITRLPDSSSSENHIYLSVREFKMRESEGLFAMHWESHGNYYGIGKEINYWLFRGFNVVVNGSREYLPTARKKYKQLRPILIETSPEILMQRLETRGRENREDIEKRMKRSYDVGTLDNTVIRIYNDGPLEESGKELISLVLGLGRATLVI